MDYHNPDGYYSETYGLTYYDGYGYNYYTHALGYYEYSRPPLDATGPGWNQNIFLIYLGAFSAILLVFIALQYRYLTAPDEEPEV